MNRVIVITTTARLDGGPYGSRLVSLFESMGIEIEFWGWDRDGSGHLQPVGHRLLLRGGGFHNRKLGAYYLAWIWVTFLAALRHAGRGSTVISLGTFSAVGPALARLIKRFKLVFINNDNVAMSYKLPKAAASVASAVEGLLARSATVHVIPTAERWSGWSGNLVVVRNTPPRSLLDAARSIATDRGYRPSKECFTLYVNGWQTETRGMGMILDTVRHLSNESFRLLLAGRPMCEQARELAQEHAVENVGQVDRKEALALYYRAHMVATFYDPAIPINRLAESNKWYECMLTGTPFVVNEEVLTAKPFRDEEACFAVPYNDNGSLERLIRELSGNPERLERTRRNLKSIPCRCLEEEFQPVFAALVN